MNIDLGRIDKVFRGIDNVFFENRIPDSELKCHLLLKYQERIINLMSKKHQDDVDRSFQSCNFYTKPILLSKLKKSSNKVKLELLPLIVYLYSYEYSNVDSLEPQSEIDKILFDFILENKDRIIKNKDSYYRYTTHTIKLISYLEKL